MRVQQGGPEHCGAEHAGPKYGGAEHAGLEHCGAQHGHTKVLHYRLTIAMIYATWWSAIIWREGVA